MNALKKSQICKQKKCSKELKQVEKLKNELHSDLDKARLKAVKAHDDFKNKKITTTQLKAIKSSYEKKITQVFVKAFTSKPVVKLSNCFVNQCPAENRNNLQQLKKIQSQYCKNGNKQSCKMISSIDEVLKKKVIKPSNVSKLNKFILKV